MAIQYPRNHKHAVGVALVATHSPEFPPNLEPDNAFLFELAPIGKIVDSHDKVCA